MILKIFDFGPLLRKACHLTLTRKNRPLEYLGHIRAENFNYFKQTGPNTKTLNISDKNQSIRTIHFEVYQEQPPPSYSIKNFLIITYN